MTVRPLLLTSCPLTFNHAHPKTEPSNLVFFQAGSQPPFGDIKIWRINRCPWERAPITNCPWEQTQVPLS